MNLPTPEERALLEAIFRLRRLNFTPIFCELTRAEFFALEFTHTYLLSHPDAKGIYVSELANALHVSPPAVSRMLRSLEARGLIERTVDRRDRRNTYLALTEEGERTRCEAGEQMRRFSTTFTQRMGAENIRTLTALLNRLIEIWTEELSKEIHRC